MVDLLGLANIPLTIRIVVITPVGPIKVILSEVLLIDYILRQVEVIRAIHILLMGQNMLMVLPVINMVELKGILKRKEIS